MGKLEGEGKEKGKWPGRFLFFHPVGIRWPFGTEVRRRGMITRVTRKLGISRQTEKTDREHAVSTRDLQNSFSFFSFF